MKRILSVLLILLLAFSVYAYCGAETAAQDPETPLESSQMPSTEAGPEKAGWFEASMLTGKLSEVQWYTWLVVALLVVLGVVLIKAGGAGWNSRILAYAAMTIAISFVLSMLRLYKMPQGGSITPLSMLPIIAFSLALGPARGALVGCAFGFLQLLHDPSVIHPLQMLADYPLAFAALALGGFARKMPVAEKYRLPLAVVIAGSARLAMAVLSGVVFFSEYAGGQNVLVYSLGYNLSYLGPDALLCLVFSFIPGIARIVGTLSIERGA
jgi:thiamine transporter